MLQDLRKVNETMELMGPLQPGLLSPAGIPRGTYKIILDLKDCFYTIPLAKEDCKRFAFSVPSTNYKEPMKRYHWKVLPQGMANSSTLCQKFVAQALQEARDKFPYIYIIHYMDNISLAHKNEGLFLASYYLLLTGLQKYGLIIAPDKVQREAPYSYLGHTLYPRTIQPQKLQLRKDELKMLNDIQKLLGDINWLCPFFKTNYWGLTTFI